MYVGICVLEHWGFSLSIFSFPPCYYYKTELNALKMLFIEISFFSVTMGIYTDFSMEINYFTEANILLQH